MPYMVLASEQLNVFQEDNNKQTFSKWRQIFIQKANQYKRYIAKQLCCLDSFHVLTLASLLSSMLYFG